MKIAFKDSKILMISGRTLTPVPGQGPEPGLHYVYTSSEGHGSISASPMSGKKDTLITLSNTPDQNYIFSKYTLNNVDLQGSSFLMPDEDAYVRGYFQPDVRTITVTKPSHGTITAPASAQIGSTVTLSCTPDTGYALQYFTVNGVQIQGNSFIMPASNVTVGASIEAINPDIFLFSYPDSQGTSFGTYSKTVLETGVPSNIPRYFVMNQVAYFGTASSSYANSYYVNYYLKSGDYNVLRAYKSVWSSGSADRWLQDESSYDSVSLVNDYVSLRIIVDTVDNKIYYYLSQSIQEGRRLVMTVDADLSYLFRNPLVAEINVSGNYSAYSTIRNLSGAAFNEYDDAVSWNGSAF